jgi:multidrug efflux pump subunit AcrA (membrane-fusion protein)
MSPVSNKKQDVDIESLPLQTSRLLQDERSYRVISRWSIGLFVVFLLSAFIPWQQNIRGTGVVSALSPMDRSQDLPSRIDGRVERWFVAEGQFVSKGSPIVQISEIKDEYLDPEVVPRTREQLDATVRANTDKRAKASALTAQIAALEAGLEVKLRQATNKLEQARAELEQSVVEDSVARDQFERRRTLFESPLGLASLNDLQAARVRAQSAGAKLVEKRNSFRNAELEFDMLRAEAREKIEKARSDRAATLAEVAEGEAKIASLRNKVSSLEQRQSFYTIDAPQDVYVVKAMKQGVGEVVKAGEPLVTVQAAAPRQAVELFLNPMDVPLLRRGRQVRLQFDGWPALQFSGWPSVSVGTFGGEVAVIDQVASANGKFRVLIVPDPNDEPWPAQLRLGSGVYGWAMLDEVPLWFELWRQLNGFPPTIDPKDAEGYVPMASGKGGK